MATVSYHKGNNKSPLLSFSSRGHCSSLPMALQFPPYETSRDRGETKEKWRPLLCEKQSPPGQICWGRGLELAPYLDLLKGLDDITYL